MEKHHQTPNDSQDTPIKTEMEGMELREEIKIWKEVASSEARLALMKNMIKNQLAFADLEEFGQDFVNKLKTYKFKNTTLYSKLSQPIMKAKMADEQTLGREMMRLKIKMKRDLAHRLEGDKTRKYKRVISHLNNLAKIQKQKSTNRK